MVTFLEWLKLKVGLVEASRLAQMTHEDLPDNAPEIGHIVIFMDNLHSKDTRIKNNDLYAVMNKGDMPQVGTAIVLVPKKFYDQAMSGKIMHMPTADQTLTIPQSRWNQFTLVNHLLTQNEKMARLGRVPIWIVGTAKDKWIARRTEEMEAEKRRAARKQGPGVSTPGELDPIKLAQFRQQFTQGAKEEAPEVSAARNWLRGS